MHSLILGIESSCDDTAAAVIEVGPRGPTILSTGQCRRLIAMLAISLCSFTINAGSGNIGRNAGLNEKLSRVGIACPPTAWRSAASRRLSSSGRRRRKRAQFRQGASRTLRLMLAWKSAVSGNPLSGNSYCRKVQYQWHGCAGMAATAPRQQKLPRALYAPWESRAAVSAMVAR